MMQIQQQIPWESVGKGSFGEVYANDAAPEKVIKLFTSSTHKNVNKNIIKREQVRLRNWEALVSLLRWFFP